MTLLDSRGVPISLADPDALAGYERALDLALGYRADPVAEIDAALARRPDFVMGHVLRATLHALAMERGALPPVAEAIRAAEATGLANERERGHLAALAAWHDGDWARAVRRWGDVLAEHPRDALALLAAHVGDFFLGWPQMLRDHPARVLPHWDEATPGYGYVLGMHAFGLEECGEYARAEEAGMRALERNRRDAWAVHAVVHVMEMEGRPAEGAAFLAARRADWAPGNLFALHNWWHAALFRLEMDDAAGALAVYDDAIRPRADAPAIELVDSTALLWRLRMRGVDAGARWTAVADRWEQLAEDGHYAFNDAHAMMAFVAADRPRARRRLLDALARGARTGTNATMARDVGLPLACAIEAVGRGAWDDAVELLLDVRPLAIRFGGSHAQRDVIALTLHRAALEAGRRGIAAAIAAERLSARPESPFARRLAAGAALPALGLAA